MTDDSNFVPVAPESANVSPGNSQDMLSAYYRLSQIEAEFLQFCFGYAGEQKLELSTDKPLTVRVRAFAERFDIGEGEAFLQMKDALVTLYDRGITINEVDEQTGIREVFRTRWLSNFSYVESEGLISVTFSGYVIGHINIIEKAFIGISIDEVKNFSSFHALRLYELMMRCTKTGSRTFGIDKLREDFGLGPTEYRIMSDFKRRTVDVAVKQINEHTSWNVSYQNHKEGVKITGLTFSIQRKPVEEVGAGMSQPWWERDTEA
jgi:plasmid replication initiation protein